VAAREDVLASLPSALGEARSQQGTGKNAVAPLDRNLPGPSPAQRVIIVSSPALPCAA